MYLIKQASSHNKSHKESSKNTSHARVTIVDLGLMSLKSKAWHSLQGTPALLLVVELQVGSLDLRRDCCRCFSGRDMLRYKSHLLSYTGQMVTMEQSWVPGSSAEAKRSVSRI